MTGDPQPRRAAPRLASALASVALALIGLSVAADALLGVPSPIAAAAEHALTQVIVWPFLLLDTLHLLPRSGPVALVVAVLGVFGLLGAARRADDGSAAATWVLDLGLGVPLLLAGLGVAASGLVASPPVVLGCLVAAAFGAVAASTGEEMLPTALGSGLPGGARRGAVLAVSVTLVLGFGAALTGRGGLGWLGGAAGWLLPWGVAAAALGGLALTQPESTPSSRAGAPLARILAAGAFGLALTCTFVGWTAPDGEILRRLGAVLPMPLVMAALGGSLVLHGVPVWPGREARVLPVALRFVVPAAAGVLGLVHAVSVVAVSCDEVGDHPAVQVLSGERGARALQPLAGSGLAVAFEDRLDLLDVSGAIGPRSIALDSLAEGAGLPGGAVVPRTLGLDPAGRLHLWADVGGDPARLLLSSDGTLVEAVAPDGACGPSSWLWDEPGKRSVAGCAWEPEAMIEDAAGLRRVTVAGAGELAHLVPGPGGRRWIGLSRWGGAHLSRIDPVRLSVSERLLVGSGHGGLASDTATGVLAVPRFVAGQLLLVEADSLAPLGAERVGWGVGPVLASRWAWLVATLDGTLHAVDADDGRIGRLHLGPIQHLALQDERTLITAGRCGVLAVDLRRWLGR